MYTSLMFLQDIDRVSEFVTTNRVLNNYLLIYHTLKLGLLEQHNQSLRSSIRKLLNERIPFQRLANSHKMPKAFHLSRFWEFIFRYYSES